MAETPPADDPGRRRSRDEIDPELVKLGRGGPRVGPLLCIAVIGFCLYLMYALWPDLSFRRGGTEPQKVASAASLIADDGPGPDAYVAANLQPDRAMALRLPGSGGQKTARLLPVHGSNNRLWVMMDGEPWVERPTYHETYEGRLKRLDDLPFADALRARTREAAVPRWVEPKALREAIDKGAPSVRDPFGDEVPVGPDTPVTLVEQVKNSGVLVAGIREFLPDEAAWLAELNKAGVEVLGGKAVERTEKELTFEVRDAEGIAGIKQKLRALQNYSFSIEPLVRRHQHTLGTLPRDLAWADLEAAALTSPRTVPGDAMVLVAGERPDSYWYVWPVFIGLGLFAALFVWALVRALRRDREPAADAPATAEPSSSTP